METDNLPLAGILLIDKSPGMTSHDVVGIVRRAFRPQKVKVGHAGTLDPDATGLLIVCIGSATRLADMLADRGKVYQARFQLGTTTLTEDSSGAILSQSDASAITEEAVLSVLSSLTGDIQQVPPMVSALHHEGKRLYDLARQGIEVERAARTIAIHRIDLLDFHPGENATGEFVVACGKGTYVRTICADLGAKLGVGGHMTELRRLSIGDFVVEDAITLDQLDAQVVAKRLIPSADAVSFLPLRRLTAEERADVLHGKSVPIGEAERAEWVRLVDESGELVALAQPEGDLLLPRKVLASAEG